MNEEVPDDRGGWAAMSGLRRLATVADVHRQADNDILRVSARLELELASRTRVVLLNDRGWGGGGWASASLNWNSLLDTARRHGVLTDVTELRQLRHDVVLTSRLLARISSAHDPY
jgi:hypothetical protein